MYLIVCVPCLGEKQQAIGNVEKLFDESKELVYKSLSLII